MFHFLASDVLRKKRQTKEREKEKEKKRRKEAGVQQKW